MSDSSTTILITGLVQALGMVIGFLTLWIKVRYGVTKAEEAVTNTHAVSRKVDNNTAITQAGATAAATSARIAAKKAEEVASQLNGVLDNKIKAIVAEFTEPIVRAFREHYEADERNMKEIRDTLVRIQSKA